MFNLLTIRISKDCSLNCSFIPAKLAEIQWQPFISSQVLILQYNFSNNFCNSLDFSLTSFESVMEASLLVGYSINMSSKES